MLKVPYASISMTVLNPLGERELKSARKLPAAPLIKISIFLNFFRIDLITVSIFSVSLTSQGYPNAKSGLLRY